MQLKKDYSLSFRDLIQNLGIFETTKAPRVTLNTIVTILPTTILNNMIVNLGLKILNTYFNYDTKVEFLLKNYQMRNVDYISFTVCCFNIEFKTAMNKTITNGNFTINQRR